MFVRAHLLHGASGSNSLWGPGNERWNIIIADRIAINTPMSKQVENPGKIGKRPGKGFDAVGRIHERDEALYYEVNVTSHSDDFSSKHYPEPFFAKEVSVTYGVLGQARQSKVFKTDLVPPKCDPNFQFVEQPSIDREDQPSIEQEDQRDSGGAAQVAPSDVEQPSIEKEAPRPDDSGGAVQVAPSECDPAEKPNFLLAEWERGNLEDEFERMEAGEIRYFNFEVRSSGARSVQTAKHAGERSPGSPLRGDGPSTLCGYAGEE